MGIYDKLYSENRRLLFYWANRYKSLCASRPAIDADDLVQAGFLGLCEASTVYDPEKGAAWSTWASFYIRTAMLDALGLRKRQKDPAVISLDAPAYMGDDGPEGVCLGETIADESSPDPDADVLRNEAAQAVRDAISAIKSDSIRQAMRRVYLDSQPRAAAARDMGITESALMGMIARGKRTLRRDWRLQRAINLDAETRFISHKSIAAFQRDMTSDVESAVIWRESKRGDNV